MANSRSLLVYVLALVVVVCGRTWVSASTVPVRELPPPASSGGALQQSQLHPVPVQKPHPKYEGSKQLSQQQSSETMQAPPAASPPAPVPVQQQLPPKQQQPQQLPHQPRHNSNAPTTMSVNNAWGLTAGNSASGPYTTGYGYITGRTLNSPSNSYMTDVDLPEHSRVQPAVTAGQNVLSNPTMNLDSLQTMTTQLTPVLHNSVDITSVLAGALLGLGAAYSGIGTRLVGMLPMSVVNRFWSEEEIETPEVKKGSDKVTRKKRDVDVQENPDLTELASIVLSAIQSGECMQRSICLLGSHIGNSNKGRAAFTLVDKLIPESVQSNQYFVTMKKALKGGDTFCDRFRCRFN